MQGVGRYWLCCWGEKEWSLFQSQSSITVWISIKSFSRKRAPQKSLLGAASRLLCKTWAQHSGVTSSWGTRQCTPHAGAQPSEGAIWISSRLPFLRGRQNPHWCLPPDAMRALLPISVALGWGYVCGIETPCSLGEVSFEDKISFSLFKCCTCVWGQPFPHLRLSYQSLYGFSCKPLVIIFQLS